eukprot:4780743-Pyramimonas_sp.AAC.1
MSPRSPCPAPTGARRRSTPTGPPRHHWAPPAPWAIAAQRAHSRCRTSPRRRGARRGPGGGAGRRASRGYP